jgi:hypothetical protein
MPKKGKNDVQKWKERNGLKHYFNMSHSPDIPPIKKAWQAWKKYINKFEHYDKRELEELAAKGWHHGVTQKAINKWVNEIPKILQDIINSNGKMVA